MTIIVLAGLLGLLMAPVPDGQAEALQAHILVQTDGPGQPVNRGLLGHNVLFAGHGLWDARRDALDSEAATLMDRLRPPFLRFPGGSSSDLYLWEDGLGVAATTAVTPESSEITLAEAPRWPGVTAIRLVDRSGGRYGDLGSLRVQEGAVLRGVRGVAHTHPPGASVRPERRPGQISWHSNAYGIVEHLKLCQAVGAQPLLTVNYGSGLTQEGVVSAAASLSQRLKRAMAWVAFTNGQTDDQRPLGVDEEGRDWQTVGYWARARAAWGFSGPLRVRYWEIGNESYARHEVGVAPAHRYGSDFLQFARAMKWVDPDIYLGAVGLTDPEGRGDADPEDPWNATVLKAAGEEMDFLIVHLYYPSAGAGEHHYATPAWFTAVMGGASQALSDLRAIRALLDASGRRGEKIKLVVSEYGIWPADSCSGRDFANLGRTLYDADLLLTLLKHGQELGVELATAWNLEGNNATAAIRFDPGTGARVLRPHYHVLGFLQSHLGKTLLPVQVSSPGFDSPRLGNVGPQKDIPCLQVLATRASPEKVYLWVVNRSLTQEITAAITIQPRPPKPPVQLQRLSGSSCRAHNEHHLGEVRVHTERFTASGSTWRHTLPPHSLTVFDLTY